MFALILQRVRFSLFFILIVLITISFHPYIQEMGRLSGMKNGTILSLYIIIVFAVLFILCFNFKIIRNSKNIKFLCVVYLFIALNYLIALSFFNRNAMLLDLRSIGICIMAIMIGWRLDLDERSYQFFILLFAGIVLLMGFMQVLVNVGGFEILDQSVTDAKNTLGVLLSTSAVIFMLFGIRAKKIVLKVLYFLLLIFAVIVLLTIRARASTLATGIMVLFILYETIKGKNFFYYALIGILLIIVVYLFLPVSIKSFVYDSFVQNHEYDITSSRSARNIAGIQFLSEHLWVGDLNVNAGLAWIHNYPLNKLYQFGLLFSFPILLTYLYILIINIINTTKCNIKNCYSFGYFILLVPFVVSMAEPTFPFGPGTGTVVNFIFFGLSIRNSYNKELNIIDNDSLMRN